MEVAAICFRMAHLLLSNYQPLNSYESVKDFFPALLRF
jgi:hypothetical protein